MPTIAAVTTSTSFPVPVSTDDRRHVYVSVGHQQMMTEAMTPLGLSVWQLTALRPMATAGGRLFVDVTDALASPVAGPALVTLIGRSDPLIADALRTVVERGDIVPPWPAPPPAAPAPSSSPIAADAALVEELVAVTHASIERLDHEIDDHRGADLFEFVKADIGELKRLLTEARSMQVIMAGFEAAWWLNDHLAEWLGERNVADTLTLAAPGNVTSQMGLDLLDVADLARRRPEVVAYLAADAGDDLLDRLGGIPGGIEVRDALAAYLDRYGMRCVGEIDLGRPRWAERPSLLVPALLADVRAFGPGEASRRVAAGRRAAEAKAADVLARLAQQPDGATRAAEAAAMIDRVRTFAGYREFPKYGIVSRYLIYKRALWREAAVLVANGALDDVEDVALLTFDELAEAVRTGRADRELVERRRRELAAFARLTPPRVLTSDGEALSGSYGRTDVPAGALVGLAVSGGVVEGRARVVHDMPDADLEPGDILVTTATDPSWTPVFLTAAGLVTEVGGHTTHGAVVAREYGLPAVVGVERATELIADRCRIRVDGTTGVVELLADA